MYNEAVFEDFYAELGIDDAAYPWVRKEEMTTLCIKIPKIRELYIVG